MTRIGIIFRGDIVPMELTFVNVNLEAAKKKYLQDVQNFFTTTGNTVFNGTNIQAGVIYLKPHGRDEGYSAPMWVGDVAVALDIEGSVTVDQFKQLASLAQKDEQLSRYSNLQIRPYRSQDYGTGEETTQQPQQASPSPAPAAQDEDDDDIL